MTTDLAVRQESAGYIVPTSFIDVAQMAKAICNTSMVPNQFRGKADETAAAILFAMEQGLPPVTGLKFIANINGINALFGDAVPGIAMRRKLIKNMREWVTGLADDMTAHCEVERPDGSKVTHSFSVADARSAKLWGKAGPWSQYPKRMLQMRARSWAVRDAAPHAFLGPTYEELVGSELPERGPDHARDVTPATAAERRAAMEAAEQATVYDMKTGEVREKPDSPRSPLTKAAAEKIRDEFDACGTAADFFAVLARYQNQLEALKANNGRSWQTMESVIADASARVGADITDFESDLGPDEELPLAGEK